MLLQPVGAVATRAMLVDDGEFFESRFYQEWAKPQGLHDAVAVKVLQTDQRAGLLYRRPICAPSALWETKFAC